MGRRRGLIPSVAAGAVAGLALISLFALDGLSGFGSELPSGRIAVRSPSVVVLKSKHVLHLFDGDRLVRTYPIDLGLNPRGQKRFQGDCRTPVGRFTVVVKNDKSPYHRFIGISYPDRSAVTFGLEQGMISQGQAVSIRDALSRKSCPDWRTALGGGLGIHGTKKGVDWTAGCIAMRDEDVAELFTILRMGDPIEILP